MERTKLVGFGFAGVVEDEGVDGTSLKFLKRLGGRIEGEALRARFF